MLTSVPANPHSTGPAAGPTAESISFVKGRVLQLIDAPPEDYDVIFTSGSTAAIRLVAEAFPWRGSKARQSDARTRDSSSGPRAQAGQGTVVGDAARPEGSFAKVTSESLNPPPLALPPPSSSGHGERPVGEAAEAPIASAAEAAETFDPDVSCFMLCPDVHTSVLGIRGVAAASGANVCCLPTHGYDTEAFLAPIAAASPACGGRLSASPSTTPLLTSLSTPRLTPLAKPVDSPIIPPRHGKEVGQKSWAEGQGARGQARRQRKAVSLLWDTSSLAVKASILQATLFAWVGIVPPFGPQLPPFQAAAAACWVAAIAPLLSLAIGHLVAWLFRVYLQWCWFLVVHLLKTVDLVEVLKVVSLLDFWNMVDLAEVLESARRDKKKNRRTTEGLDGPGTLDFVGFALSSDELDQEEYLDGVSDLGQLDSLEGSDFFSPALASVDPLISRDSNKDQYIDSDESLGHRSPNLGPRPSPHLHTSPRLSQVSPPVSPRRRAGLVNAGSTAGGGGREGQATPDLNSPEEINEEDEQDCSNDNTYDGNNDYVGSTPHLLAITAESNFDGTRSDFMQIINRYHGQRQRQHRHRSRWIKQQQQQQQQQHDHYYHQQQQLRGCRRRKTSPTSLANLPYGSDPSAGEWYTLLDAAKYICTSPLSLRRCPADFVPISFYKLFGYPTGLGALIVRRSSSQP